MDRDRQLIKLLAECNLIPFDVDPSLYASKNSCPIRMLSKKGLINEQEAMKALSKRLSIPYVDLDDPEIISKCTVSKFLSLLPSTLCWSHKVLPIYQVGNSIVVAMANPLDAEVICELKFALSHQINPAICQESKITHQLSLHFSAMLSTSHEEKPTDPQSEVELLSDESIFDESDLDESEEGLAPTVKTLNRVLIQAAHLRASDVHFDPTPSGLDIRYRIDGLMQHIFDAPKRVQRPLVSRVKLLAGMDISERRKPQDGRFRIKIDREPIDVRASCIPTAYGEKIVLRFLNTGVDSLSFEKLGFPADIRKQFENALHSDSKMILVSGPTGSGKTTTLYTALKYLIDGTTNIETVEDPVEYKIAGINQMQVNEGAGVTFASALRAMLRQDPDVIMVGEIRDRETAEISLQAAQTGHIVLSTIHTNDAPSAVTRLLNLGCDPFIISSSVAGVMAQRLVRRICQQCSAPADASYCTKNAELISKFKIDRSKLRVGAGCDACRYTGYHGRLGLYSYLNITAKISELIAQKTPMRRVIDVAKTGGFKDIDTVAIEAVIAGHTSLEEISRHLGEAPLFDDLNPGEYTPDSSDEKSSHHKTTILLVEDDLNNRQNLAFYLRSNHYRVLEAKDGLEALNSLKLNPPDILIAGLGLPHLDGKQLLTKIRQNELGSQKKVPFLVLTSADSDENEAELLKLGANDFVSRSKSPEVLLERIKKLSHH